MVVIAMKQPVTIRVQFGEHMAKQQIDSMCGALLSSGDMSKGENERTFFVKVHRDGKLDHLKQTLHGWERWGFVRWSEIP
jgi:hypothetical protein